MGRVVELLVGLAVLSVLFAVLEWRWPSVKGQRRWRKGIKTDVAWWFWDPIVNKTVSFVGVLLVVLVMAKAAGVPLDSEHIKAWVQRQTVVSRQPGLLQAVELLVLFDLIGYWSHRAFHELETLWRFHAVHHSAAEVDWLSSVRVHPVNEVLQRMAQAVPLVLVGYSPGLLAAYIPLLTFYAIMLHANVDWTFGRLRYVVASPIYHRWHHTSESEGLNKNFSGMFPWIDALFGTIYLPKDRRPMVFGVAGETVPDNLWSQLMYPFRKKGTYAV